MDGSLMSGTTTYFGITYPTSTDLVKDGASNMQTIATGFDSAVAIPTYNAQTGTTYTFALTDIGKTVTASNAGASTYTIPPQASVVWPTDATLEITNLGAGVVTFAAGAGVTVTNTASTLSQYGSAALIRTGLNAWTVTPRSGGASGLTLIKSYTMSAVSSLSFDANTFSSTYRNYKIIIQTTGTSVLLARLRAAGSDITTSNYRISNLQINGASITGTSGVSTSFGFQPNAVASSTMTMELLNPQATEITKLNYALGSGDEISVFGTGNFGLTTSFDSMTFFPNTGTFSGNVSVYGYAN